MSPAFHPANDTCLIRRAGPLDQRLLTELLREAADDTDIDVSSATVVREALADNIVLVASYDSGLIGCIMATPGPTTILHNLAIVPAQRRRGHATGLIGAMIDLLQKQGGVDALWTAIDPNLPDGMRRFERHGFSVAAGMTCREMTLMTRPATHPTPRPTFTWNSSPLPPRTAMTNNVARDAEAIG